MVNLYTLPAYVVVLFIGVILCLFLANSVLYYYLMPQAQFRQLGRKCLEGSSLLLLMAVAAILYEVYTDSLSGIVYDEATDFWRYSTALAGTAGAVYWIHDRQAGSLLVLAASILLLPVFDDWLPGSLVLALVCLAWRLIFLFPRTYDQYQQHLTARSIQTGTGLQAMEQRVRALGGRLTLTKTPHFIVTVEMGENHDPTDHRRRPKNLA